MCGSAVVLNLPPPTMILLCRNPLEQFAGRFVVGVLRHQLAHDRELEDGLLEGVEAGFGGEQGVEVFG